MRLGQWLYPVPSIIALAGWIYIFQGAGWSAIRIMLAWTGLGVVAFLIWARIEHTWPFGPKVIREQFLEEHQAEPVQAEHRNAARTASRVTPAPDSIRPSTRFRPGQAGHLWVPNGPPVCPGVPGSLPGPGRWPVAVHTASRIDAPG